jgi:putative sigma-54 modulation protein
MRVSYRGIKREVPATIQKKLDSKFAKLSRLLEKRGEQEAHVVLTLVRHLHKAEVTIQFYDHKLVGIGSSADEFTALTEALEKLEIQAVKNRGKWQERRREGPPKDGSVKAEPAKEASSKEKAPSAKPTKTGAGKNGGKAVAPAGVKRASTRSHPPVNLFRANHHDTGKPMTLDEAMLEMEEDRDYVAYRDAKTERVSVLVRRRDGHFDLIEG